MIHRRAGTVGDQSSYNQQCSVAVNIVLVTITLLFTQGRELSVTKTDDTQKGGKSVTRAPTISRAVWW